MRPIPNKLPFDQQFLKEQYYYEDGKLYYLKGKGRKLGDPVGRKISSGYHKVKIKGKEYQRSRIIWLLVKGVDVAPLVLDHINRVKDDDRIENLRPVTNNENQRNRSWGVSPHRYIYYEENRWRVRVSLPSGGRKSLGRYETEEEAIKVIKEWEQSNG